MSRRLLGTLATLFILLQAGCGGGGGTGNGGSGGAGGAGTSTSSGTGGTTSSSSSGSGGGTTSSSSGSGGGTTSSSSGSGGGASTSSSSSSSSGGCTDECTLGEKICDGDAVRTCAQAGACTALSPAVPCGANQVCSGGVCTDKCTNQCVQGTTQCSGAQIQLCTPQSNGCTDWSVPAACPANNTCVGGACVLACTDKCPTAGAKQCQGDAVQTCTQQSNGCLDWSAAAACPTDQSCSGGVCMACTNGATRCSAGGNVEMCQSATWFQTQICGFGCNGGSCLTNVTCTPGMRQCNGNTSEICNGSGTAFLYSQTCAVACTNGLCTGACTPGEKRCNGNGVEQCNAMGTAWTALETCSTLCDDATKKCALASLDVTLDTSLDGEIVVAGPVVIKSGATLTSPTGNLTIRATSITVELNGSITAAPTGQTATGAGKTGPNYGCGASGGSYGTAGSNNATGNSCSSGAGTTAAHGSSTDVTIVAGSRGGTGNNYSGTPGNGGLGGGRIALIADVINIAGQVTAPGQNGGPASGGSGVYAGGGGGGSGGGILIAANSLTISGAVSAAGGAGGAGSGYGTQGGGGGLGRVKLLYGTTNNVTGTITGTKTQALLPPLTITSSTHPDPNIIYNDDFALVALTWNKAFPSVQGYFQRTSTTQNQVPTPSPPNAFIASELVTVDRAAVVAGSNWFHIAPVDQASNVGIAENQFLIQVNTTPPTVSSTSHPNQTAWNASQNVFYAWSLPTADANTKGYHYVLDHYGTTVPTKADTFLPVSQKQILLSNLAPGIWAFHVVAEDVRGYLTKQAGHYRVRIGADPGMGGILGNVVDQGSVNVAGATVTINKGLLAPGTPDQTTAANGSYNFGSAVPAGTWEVTVTKAGFAPQTKMITVMPGQSSTANFTLTP